jgi:ABC-type lipoprotein export system ATPase subunit
MIKIKSLSKTYKLEDVTFDALKNINLEIGQGEFVIVLGQSGCGKSTLLNIIGGMDIPTSGSVEVAGRNLASLKTDQLARYRREKIGMIFQKFNLVNDATVIENVRMPLKFSGRSDKEETRIAKEALEIVGLTNKTKSLPKKLSGGQQQRVAIARALVNSPEILLCDEPTGNLDSKTGEEIIELLSDLNKKWQTVIMVTHNEAYTKYADRVIRMLDGEIISQKSSGKPKPVAKVSDSKKGKNISLLSQLKMAVKNLKRRKLRFILTSFGIAIGAMAVVILVSFGAGLQKEVNDQLKASSQVEEITVAGEKVSEVSFSVGTDFTKTDKKPLNDSTISMLEKLPNVEAVYVEAALNGELRSGDKKAKLYLQGMMPLKYVKDSDKEKVKYGNFFTADDENGIILPYGQAVALGFDDPANSIGKEVTVSSRGQDFKTKIIGVIGKDEKFAFNTFVPGKVAENWLKVVKAENLKNENPDLYDEVIARASDPGKVPELSLIHI